MSLINVTIPHNGINYSVSLSPQKVEEISSDPEKYDELLMTILKREPDDDDDDDNESEEMAQAEFQSESMNDNKVLLTNSLKHPTPTPSKWSHESITLMLNLRLGREKEFSKPTCKKSKLWEDVSEQMKLLGNYTISSTDCDIKYRNLLQTYRINKEKQMKSDEAKIAWPYFEMFDSALGHKVSCSSRDLLCKTLSKTNLLASLELSALDEDDDVDLQLPSKRPKPDRTSSSCNELTLEQYLFLKNEREEKQWQEKKKLKLLEVKAINNLADAIKSIGEL